MAPPPEYDKEPKAPDKCVSSNNGEDSKVPHSTVHDQQSNSDNKPANSAANVEPEDKNVEALDDGQLRALLDEAITYKCPKDREGKSSLFKELLEEVEQDEQACEAAARSWGAGAAAGRARGVRATGGGGRQRRALPHSNSLQDLVAALAAEPAPRRRPHNHGHHQPVAQVSARTHHGGSLPSGVDTSFLLGEEVRGATRGVEYVATVHCENPSPLNERRVSASDAHCPAETEALNRRSKMAAFPMTYTARATLEIGSGAVCSGRAVTTTTASNQVRTRSVYTLPHMQPGSEHEPRSRTLRVSDDYTESGQKLMSALKPKGNNGGGAAKVEPRGLVLDGLNRDGKPNSVKKKRSGKQSAKVVTDGGQTGSRSDKKATVKTSEKAKETTQPAFMLDKSQRKITKSNKNKKPFKESNKYTNPEPLSEPFVDLPLHPSMFVVHRNASYNYIETKTGQKVTVGPPEKLFNNNLPKSKYRHNVHYSPANFETDNLFLKQYFNNCAFKTNPIIYKQNSKPGEAFKPCPTVSFDLNSTKKKQRNHEENNNAKSSAKPNPSFDMCRKHIDVQIPTTSRANNNFVNKPVKDESISEQKIHERISKQMLVVHSVTSVNPRNVRPMTIGMILPPVPSIDNYNDNKTPDEAHVTDKATVDKDYKSDCTTLASGHDKMKIKTGVDINIENDNTEMQIHVADEFSNAEDISSNKLNLVPSIDIETKMHTSDQSVTTNDTLQKNSLRMSEIKADESPLNQSLETVKIEMPLDDAEHLIEMKTGRILQDETGGTEMGEIFSKSQENATSTSNSDYFALQMKLFQALERSNEPKIDNVVEKVNICEMKGEGRKEDKSNCDTICKEQVESSNDSSIHSNDVPLHVVAKSIKNDNKKPKKIQRDKITRDDKSEDILSIAQINNKETTTESIIVEQCTLTELSNSPYVFLTLPEHLLPPISNTATENYNKPRLYQRRSSKEDETEKVINTVDISSDKSNTKTLRMQLIEKLIKDGVFQMTPRSSNQVDSGIPFSCITTPEVVASCNTTSSSPQAAVAVDAKPLQLCSGYRAVASLIGGAVWLERGGVVDTPVDVSVTPTNTTNKPRSSSTSYNGLPLSRPANYGATASSSDEYKKSLDENGNSVQGFSSPLSGSSQHKKPRRKKSSKNETVIKSHQIDGYQGNKDLNEVLRFIESNEEQTRGKLHRVTKHKDDSDDKTKKRSTERRGKDKEKGIKRATSMEELSRTKLEDLTDKPELRRGKKDPPASTPARAAERRSWGDDTRDTYYYDESTSEASSPPVQAKHEKKKAKPSKSVDSAPLEPHSDTAVELMDFQTVTKKKKQRKRFEEGAGSAGGGEYRKPRPASPERRRKSAPPSDKSNDSNDDMDSVHSLPADLPPAATPAPLPAPHASYADIARTRHNIPDLIESCNFYTDEPVEAPRPAPPREPPAPAIDVESYPALDARAPRTRNKPAPRVAPPVKEFSIEKPAEERREAKPRTTPAPVEAPAEETTVLPPDVVSDRRPPVILLDEASRPRDMDGVTFGFDINEQLLNGETACGVRARRCDLLRDALADEGGGVCVRAEAGAGCGLRYVPPPAPLAPTTLAHLHRIVDYVGGAWEDIMKCGSGKVRYFTE